MKKWEYLVVHFSRYRNTDGDDEISFHANNQNIKEEKTITEKLSWGRTEKYTVLEYPAGIEQEYIRLNYFGNLGWELISIEKRRKHDDDDVIYYFKREK